MQFYEPGSFIYLWLIAALLLIAWQARNRWRDRLAKLGSPLTIQNKLMPAYRREEWLIRNLLLAFALLFTVTALARPQWGEERKKVERKGIDIIFLIDSSLSMLCEDVKPNRLEKAKLEIKNILHRLKGDRVGMVAFSGSSFLQAPLTLDYAAFMLFMDAVQVGYIPDPGTSLERAIRLAIKSFPETELKHKAIVLFTDGEDHEGGMDEAIAEAKKLNARVYTIGTGSLEGAPIPLKGEQGQQTGFKKDRAGQIVITKLNEELLQKIATETSAVYFPSTPGEQEVPLILKHMSTIGQKKYKEKIVTEREDHFQIFLFFAFLFFAAELLVRRRKKTKTGKNQQPITAVFLIGAAFLFSGFLESPASLVKKGQQSYEEKKYQSAIEQFRKAQVKSPDNPVVQYDLGTTLYQTDEYQEAARNLEKALSTAKDPETKAKILYNYGNTQYRLGNFEKSIESYQKALEFDPKDVDAKYNLELLTKQKSMFEKKDQERKKQQQQKQDQQQDQQKQQQQQQQKQQQQQQQQDQQQDQQKDQEQEEQQQDQQKDQEQEEQQQPDQGQGEEETPEQKEQQDQESEQKKDKQEGQELKEEEQEQQGEQQPEPQSALEEQQNQERKAPKPLQGQMTLPEALRVLDALKESDKELQDLRRPPVNPRSVPPEKDW